MTFDAEITVVCEKIKPGCEFTARFFDRESYQFFGARADAALEAVAWCIDEYVARQVFRMPHRMARDGNARPGDRFIGRALPAECP